MLFKIGEYRDGEKPDWAAIYDAAMARHLETSGWHALRRLSSTLRTRRRMLTASGRKECRLPPLLRMFD
jgi:hypothetical protein